MALTVAGAVIAVLSLMPLLPPAVSVPVRGLGHFMLFTAAWVVAVAAAAAEPQPWMLLVAAPWLAFYALLSLTVYAGTPVAITPILVILSVTWWSLRTLSSRATAFMLWTAAAVGFAWASAAPSGLRRALAWSLVATVSTVAATVALAGGLLLIRTQPWPREAPAFRRVATAAAAVFTIALALAACRSLATTLEWADAMVADLAAIVVLFWMWLGGRAGVTALHFAEWVARQMTRAVEPMWRVVFVVAVIGVVTAIEAVRVFRALLLGLDQLALAIHAMVGALVLIVILWGRVVRPWSVAPVVRLSVWWFATLVLLEGGNAAVRATIAAGAHSVMSIAGIAVAVIGLGAELSTRERAWGATSYAGIRRQLAWLIISVSCAVILSTMPGVGWTEARTLMVLTGLLHVALPMGVLEGWRRHRRERVQNDWSRAVWFAGGYAGGLVVLAIDPTRDAALWLLAPVLGLATAIWSRRTLVTPSSAVLGGALFAAGAVAAWMMPYPPTLPFSRLRPWADVLAHWDRLGRVLLSGHHAGLLVTAWVVGASVGWTVCRLVPRRLT